VITRHDFHAWSFLGRSGQKHRGGNIRQLIETLMSSNSSVSSQSEINQFGNLSDSQAATEFFTFMVLFVVTLLL
ncbi:hypothetical protein DVA81_19285, partial [Acinetobacter baumannii]